MLRWQASQRKGTGFLTAKELADLPSEDEEEDSPDSPTANETEARGCKIRNVVWSNRSMGQAETEKSVGGLYCWLHRKGGQ